MRLADDICRILIQLALNEQVYDLEKGGEFLDLIYDDVLRFRICFDDANEIFRFYGVLP